MVRVSFEQKPYRQGVHGDLRRHLRGQPERTRPRPGRGILAEHPDSTGSLGIAISEAVEVAAQRDDTKYALGSVLNHVLMHQTVIGLEADAPARAGRRLSGRGGRLHRRGQQLRRHRLPVHRQRSCAAGATSSWWRWSRRQLPDPHQAVATPTTSATPRTSLRW